MPVLLYSSGELNYFDFDVSNLQELEPVSIEIKRTGELQAES